MMNIPDFTDKDYESLDAILLEACELAQTAYADVRGNYAFIRDLDFVPQSWGTFKPQICRRFNTLSGAQYDQIGEELEQLGQISFTPMSGGDQASVMLSTDIRRQFFTVTRISEKPENRKTLKTKRNERVKSSHMLQAIKTINQGKTQAQIMPCIAMFNSDKVNGFIALMYKLYEGSCFVPSIGISKDTAVLPDGTILCVDPDAFVYENSFYRLSDRDRLVEIDRSLALIQQRSEEWELPAQLTPLQSNGVRRQYDFFNHPAPITQ